MADGDFHDPFGPGPHFSKRELLAVAIRCGAIATARLNGEELPYPHALFHATELEAEGLFWHDPDPPVWSGVEDLMIWMPTEAAKPGSKSTLRSAS